MPVGRAEKDADSTEPFSVDWSKFLPVGLTITTSTWEIEGFDDAVLTLPFDKIEDGGLITKVWASGGTPGKRYRLRNHIETGLDSDSQKIVADESVVLFITQK